MDVSGYWDVARLVSLPLSSSINPRDLTRRDRALAPGMTFTGIDITNHTVGYWTQGATFTPSWSTLPFAAQGVVQALKYPEQTKNTVVFVRAFEASQQQIVAELERQQGAKYSATDVDANAIIKEAKARLDGGDASAAFTLVQAAFLTPDFGADFVGSKKNVGNAYMELPELTLEKVIKDVLSHAA